MLAGSDAFIAWQRAKEGGQPWAPPVHEGLKKFDAVYEWGPALGAGSFGEVREATHRATGATVAIKSVATSGDPSHASAAHLLSVDRELRALQGINHPNIVALVEAFVSGAGDAGAPRGLGRSARFVLELCAGVDLQRLIDAWGALPVDQAQSITAQLASAVQHMHERGVVHRDLKPANVVIVGADACAPLDAADGPAGPAVVKVIDFGLATALPGEFAEAYRAAAARRARRNSTGRRLRARNPRPPLAAAWSGVVDGSAHRSGSRGGSGPSTRTGKDLSRTGAFEAEPSGTRAFTAPEVLSQVQPLPGGRGPAPIPVPIRATALVDAYALGCILRTMLTGAPPDAYAPDYIAARTGNPVVALARLVRLCAGKPVAVFRYMSDVPDRASNLAARLTDPDEGTRMTVSMLRRDPWVLRARLPGDGPPQKKGPGTHPAGDLPPVKLSASASRV